jgi:hypothetical protein
MLGTFKKNRLKELRFSVGDICISVTTANYNLYWTISRQYGDFISGDQPDILIDIRQGNFLKPNNTNLIFQTRSCHLGREKGRFFIYFPSRGGFGCLARFSCGLKKVEFYGRAGDIAGPFSYLLPAMLLGLKLLRHQAVMLHGCAVLVKGKPYLFVADSRGGKSTLAKLALSCAGRVLNDDRVIIQGKQKRFKAYATPWHGEVEETSNASIPLKKIFFLKKSTINKITSLSKAEATLRLFKNSIYLPLNHAIIKKVLAVSYTFAHNLDCYELSFKADRSIWEFLDEFNG